jgi:hypothetical protein
VRRPIAILAVASSLLAAASFAAPGPASAGDREDVEKEGRCSQGTRWELDLSEEDGRIEVEFEVDQNRNGVRWNVVLRQRGAVVFRGERRTRGPSGSFTVRRVLPDRPGPDRITARATRRSGEICRASAVW